MNLAEPEPSGPQTYHMRNLNLSRVWGLLGRSKFGNKSGSMCRRLSGEETHRYKWMDFRSLAFHVKDIQPVYRGRAPYLQAWLTFVSWA